VRSLDRHHDPPGRKSHKHKFSRQIVGGPIAEQIIATNVDTVFLDGLIVLPSMRLGNFHDRLTNH
jgi:hypothetical protein